jgi:hypothetical protein
LKGTVNKERFISGERALGIQLMSRLAQFRCERVSKEIRINLHQPGIEPGVPTSGLLLYCAFVVYFATLSVSEIWRRIVGWFMNDELERIWKEGAVS